NQSYVCISIIEYTVGIQGINQFGQCRFTSCPIERRVIKRFFLIAIELVFKVNLYQIIGDYFGDYIIMRSTKTVVCFKIKRIQPQPYIVFSTYKEILIEKRVATTVILVKINIVVKELCEFFLFLVKVFLYLLLSIRFFCLYFIDSVIVNEFCNNDWFLIFEKVDLFIYTIKAIF